MNKRPQQETESPRPNCCLNLGGCFGFRESTPGSELSPPPDRLNIGRPMNVQASATANTSLSISLVSDCSLKAYSTCGVKCSRRKASPSQETVTSGSYGLYFPTAVSGRVAASCPQASNGEGNVYGSVIRPCTRIGETET